METVSLTVDRVVEGGLLLYDDLAVLTLERHGDAALASRPEYGFATAQPVVPLTIEEFERAALDYPIVFFGARRRAFAVTGLSAGRNDFIDAGGDYCGGAYVPAYLRRYPFVLVADPQRDLSVLAVDERADALRRQGGAGARPLFVDGAPSETTRAMLALCERYAAAERETDALVALLDELDLFETRQAHHRPRQADGGLGEPVLLIDYAAVDRARWEALDADAIARVRAAGGLGPIYAHLMSAANWDRLAMIGDG